MQSYEQKKWWKRILALAAICIGLFSILYTNKLVKLLTYEEDKKIKLWAEATRQLPTQGENPFFIEMIRGNETIPIILTDEKDAILSARNLDTSKLNDTKYLSTQLKEMKLQHEPIKIIYDEQNGSYNLLYYKNSTILTQLKTYPIIQLALIMFFVVMSYLAFSSSRKAEQNQVWVGMSKETAHQLGTPISSLNEWVNMLAETPKEKQDEIVNELRNDVKRLELITERFSKIGSEPELKTENLNIVVENSIQYLRARTSNKIKFNINIESPENLAKINVPLFDWVLENICKNAIDAMNGEGSLNIKISRDDLLVYIDISDTGKGIPKSKFKTVFKPGYTTKKRGWGLGLSLVRRIIFDYHKGKIVVRNSDLRKGTTFRISLNAE